MNVIEATTTEFKRHPALIGGAVLGIVLIGYLLTRSGGGSNVVPGPVYSVGPSDAAISAGAAIQIAQIQANASTAQYLAGAKSATDIAGIQGTASVNLASLGATVAMHASDNAVVVNGQNDAVAAHVSDNNLAVTQSNNSLGWHVSDNETELGATQANFAAQVQINQQDQAGMVAMAQDTHKYMLDHDIIANNAATTGSIILQNSITRDKYYDALTAAANSGASSDSLGQLRLAAQDAVTGINALIPSSGLWQSFNE